MQSSYQNITNLQGAHTTRHASGLTGWSATRAVTTRARRAADSPRRSPVPPVVPSPAAGGDRARS